MKIFLNGIVMFLTMISSVFALPEPKLPKDFLRVPIFQQETDYSCGAVNLLSILKYWGVYDGTEQSLYDRLEVSPKSGTEPHKIVDVAREFGLKAYFQKNVKLEDLKGALKKKMTVILDLQAWKDKERAHIPWSDDWDDGHYVVLIGMDRTYLYAMDPSAEGGYAYLPLDEFLERWHDIEGPDDQLVRYYHLAIFIQGKVAQKIVSSTSLVRME